MESQTLKFDLVAVYLDASEVAQTSTPRRKKTPRKQEVYLRRWIEQVKDTEEYQRRVAWKSPF